MPYAARTAGQLMLRLAEMLGDLQFDGTATTGASASLTDPALPWNSNDDEGVIGGWVFTTGGTSSNDERIAISPYTASTGLTTVDRNFSSTPDDTTTYIITRKYRPTFLLHCLQDAQRYQDQAGITSLPIIGREVVIGSALPNNFDLFTTTDVPDSLTLDTNSAFVSQTPSLGGRRILRMITDGTNAGFVRYSIIHWGEWQSQAVRLYIHLWSSVAARTTVQITDGVTTTTETATTNSDWELLKPTHTMGDTATELRVGVEVSAGSAVTVRMAYWYVPVIFGPPWSHELDADHNVTAIGDMRISKSSVQDTNPAAHIFPLNIISRGWDVFEDTQNPPRRLRLNVPSAYAGHVLEYKAAQRHAELTSPTVSYTGSDLLILARAKYYALLGTEEPDGVGRMPLTSQAEKDMVVAERPIPKGLAVPVPVDFQRVLSQ